MKPSVKNFSWEIQVFRDLFGHKTNFEKNTLNTWQSNWTNPAE